MRHASLCQILGHRIVPGPAPRDPPRKSLFRTASPHRPLPPQVSANPNLRRLPLPARYLRDPKKERVTFSTSPLEAEILERRVLELKLKGGPRRDANVSRVVEDALRDRISGGELDLSVLDNPKRSMSATRYSRTALVHYEVYKDLMTGLVSARAAHPEILPSNLTTSAYIRACILALEN